MENDGFFSGFHLCPKNPDPSKMAILRTPKHPCVIQVRSPFHWRVQPGILRVGVSTEHRIKIGASFLCLERM